MDNAQYLYNFFLNKGLAPHHVAGILSNLEAESNYDPRARGDNGTSGGIAQWHNDRLKGLNQFAYDNSADANELSTQAEYLWHELNNSHKDVLGYLQGTDNPGDAAATFAHLYERPKSKDYSSRVSGAERLANFFISPANADETPTPNEPIYADTYEEAVAARQANPNAQIFIKADAQRPAEQEQPPVINQVTEPETSSLEAAAHGAGNWGLGGFADELSAALGTFASRFDPQINDKSMEEVYKGILDSARRRSEVAWQEHPGAYGTGAVLGTVGSPINKVLAGAGLIKGGAVAGGIYGAGNSTAEDPTEIAQDALTGSAMGAATGGVLKGVGKGAQSVLQGGDKTQPAQEQLAKLGQDWNVDLAPADLRGMQKFGRQAENLPFSGFPELRQKQNDQLRSSIGNFIEDFNKLPQSVEDAGAHVKRGLDESLRHKRNIVGKAYDAIDNTIQEKILNGQQVPPINLSNTALKIDEMTGRFGSPFNRLPDDLLQTRLEKMKGDVGSELSFSDARLLREQLGDYISRAYKSAGQLGDKHTNALTEIKKALDNEIDAWGSSTGHNDITNLYRTANQKYRDLIVPFKSKALKPLLSPEGDSDTFIKAIVKNNRPKLAQKYMDATQKTSSAGYSSGQEALRYGVLKEAFDNAVTGEHFNPNSFVEHLNKLGTTKNALFSQTEISKIEGLNKLIKAIPRTSDFWTNPNNGQLANQILAGGLEAAPLITGHWTAGVVIPTALAVRAMATPSMSKILTRAGMAGEVSPGLIKQFIGNLSLLAKHPKDLIKEK